MRSILSSEEKRLLFILVVWVTPQKKTNTEAENHNFGVPAVCFFGVHPTTQLRICFFGGQ